MTTVTAATAPSSLWLFGFTLGVCGSFGTGLAKLAIRKSWIITAQESSIMQKGDGRDSDNNNTACCNNSCSTTDDDDDDDDDDGSSSSSITATSSSHSGDEIIVDQRHHLHHDNINTDNDEYSLLSSLSLQQQQQRQRKAVWIRRIGLFYIVVVNPIVAITSLACLSPSICGTFTGLSLAWVVLLAQPMIGERPNSTQTRGAGLVILGEIIVSAFGDHTSHFENMTTQSIADSYKESSFIILVASFIFVEMVLFYIMFYASPSEKRKDGSNKNNSLLITTQRIAWGVSGGMLAGFECFIKDAITMIQIQMTMLQQRQQQQYTTAPSLWILISSLPYCFYVLVLVAAILPITGFTIFNKCMKQYDATFSSGLLAGSLTLTSSIMSAVHYHTFDHLSPTGGQYLYPIGLCCLLMGVILLIQKTATFEEGEEGGCQDITSTTTTITQKEVEMMITTVSDNSNNNDNNKMFSNRFANTKPKYALLINNDSDHQIEDVV